MHTKREMVCTGLPEAMLISSTALTMPRMAPSRTALKAFGPVLVLSKLSYIEGHPVFYLNLARTLEGRPTRKLKFGCARHSYNLYFLCRIRNAQGRWQRSASMVAANDARQILEVQEIVQEEGR